MVIRIGAEEPSFDGDDRDSILKKIIEMDEAERRLSHANSHLGGDLAVVSARPCKYRSEILDDTERGYDYYSEMNQVYNGDEKVTLIIVPSWSVMFPPYGIARLTAVLRNHHYDVTVYDMNVSAYQYFKDNNYTDYWDGNLYYMWEQPAYGEHIHEKLKPLLDEYIQKILDRGTTVVGLTLYLTNLAASLYVIKELKRLDPTILVVVGGPESFNDWFEEVITNYLHFDPNLIDYRVRGEGEIELLNILENYKDWPTPTKMVTRGGLKSRANLNEMPFPDYRDYDLSLYQHPDGVSIETSRGCVAKCAFCAETWFWKYRWRTSDKVIAEIKHQIDEYNVRRFWFVDSLANGNFKEFKRLVELMVEDKLDISWNSYARCDGRIDLEMFKLIRESGCVSLSFGVESGSQKVLDDMKKKVDIWEIEANLRDSALANMKNHVNWVVGFPTEGPAEFVDSLQLLYNARKHIYAISPGYTCGDAPFSAMHTNWKQFDMAWIDNPGDNKFMSNWWTTGYKSTIVHRSLRLKFMNIWLHLLVKHAGGSLINPQARTSIEDFYDLEFHTDLETIPDDALMHADQSFEHFKSDNVVTNFSDSVVNEYLSFAWIMHRAFGAFSMTIYSDSEKDLQEFGSQVSTPYDCTATFSVDADGILDFTAKQRFEHRTNKDDGDVARCEVVREDMSFDWIDYDLNCPIAHFDGTPVLSTEDIAKLTASE